MSSDLHICRGMLVAALTHVIVHIYYTDTQNHTRTQRLKNCESRLGVVMHAFIPALARQVHLWEFKASLIYVVSLRSVGYISISLYISIYISIVRPCLKREGEENDMRRFVLSRAALLLIDRL